jgi:hypothetical protein
MRDWEKSREKSNFDLNCQFMQRRGFLHLSSKPLFMKKIILATIVLLAVACSTSKHPGGERDGSSAEKAIVIRANSENEGVGEEYTWLKKQYPGYTRKEQALVPMSRKTYDVLTITTADGVEKVIYFDITGFFGKF